MEGSNNDGSVSTTQHLDLKVTTIHPSHKPDNKRVSFLAEGSTAVQLADTGVSCVEEVASSTPQEPDPLECEVRQAVLSIAEAASSAAGPPVTLLQIA